MSGQHKSVIFGREGPTRDSRTAKITGYATLYQSLAHATGRFLDAEISVTLNCELLAGLSRNPGTPVNSDVNSE